MANESVGRKDGTIVTALRVVLSSNVIGVAARTSREDKLNSYSILKLAQGKKAAKKEEKGGA